MSEIDLIPTDYRNRLWLQSRAQILGTAIIVLLLVTALICGGLHLMAGSIAKKIATLQKQQAITTQQRNALTLLNNRKNALDRQLALLTGLRSGAAAPTMFNTIDRAITAGDIWFQNWDFRRAGTVVDRKQEPSSNGYFIVIPADRNDRNSESWKIETHMTIKGQAKDHSALSRFVRRLFEQPEIADIKILNTNLGGNKKFVDFNLAVTVNSSGVRS